MWIMIEWTSSFSTNYMKFKAEEWRNYVTEEFSNKIAQLQFIINNKFVHCIGRAEGLRNKNEKGETHVSKGALIPFQNEQRL